MIHDVFATFGNFKETQFVYIAYDVLVVCMFAILLEK